MRFDFDRGLALVDERRVRGLTCDCGRPAVKGVYDLRLLPLELVAHACDRCALVVDGAVVFAGEKAVPS